MVNSSYSFRELDKKAFRIEYLSEESLSILDKKDILFFVLFFILQSRIKSLLKKKRSFAWL